MSPSLVQCSACEDWGCRRCGKTPAAQHGEQGPSPEELQHARELDAAVAAERARCVAFIAALSFDDVEVRDYQYTHNPVVNGPRTIAALAKALQESKP